MKIANNENCFKLARKTNKKTANKVAYNKENQPMISMLESVMEEKQNLMNYKNTYDYEYLLMDYQDFYNSTLASFDEIAKERIEKLNNEKMLFKVWVKEIKEIAKIRLLFLKNNLTS